MDLINLLWEGLISDQSYFFSSHQPEQEEDDLNPTDDGEATEKPQGASDHAQLGVELHLLVSLDVVEGGRVKEDLNQLQGWGWYLFP